MINKLTFNNLNRFNELGTIINRNFSNLYDLKFLIDSEFDYLYGYFVDEQLVAFIHLSKLYETLDIVNIVVDINFRGIGIATKLLNYCISLFDDVESIMLEVNENNDAAISLYRSNDFEIINKRKKYYGNEDALIMKRVIK